MATTREQRVMDAARAMARDQDAGRPLTPALLALVGAVCAADDAPQPTPAAPDAPHVGAIARQHAAAARIDRYRLPAEVLATLADVPALLAWIAAEPARTAAAVAGERERLRVACERIRDRELCEAERDEREGAVFRASQSQHYAAACAAIECADALDARAVRA